MKQDLRIKSLFASFSSEKEESSFFVTAHPEAIPNQERTNHESTQARRHHEERTLREILRDFVPSRLKSFFFSTTFRRAAS
jgi:hypothetical protein